MSRLKVLFYGHYIGSYVDLKSSNGIKNVCNLRQNQIIIMVVHFSDYIQQLILASMKYDFEVRL